MCATLDYAYDFNMSGSEAPPTTYLPEDFTYLPNQVCPERLLSMSKYTVVFSIWTAASIWSRLVIAKPEWKPESLIFLLFLNQFWMQYFSLLMSSEMVESMFCFD